MNKIFKSILLIVTVGLSFTSCDDFVFGNVHVDYNENPLNSKGVAHSGADKYVDSLSKVKVSGDMANPASRVHSDKRSYHASYRHHESVPP